MTLAEIADIVQAVNLAGFAACLVFALYVSWRYAWTRMWLLPLVIYTANGMLFYAFTVANFTSVEVRTMWSACLRLNGIVLILAGLSAALWLLHQRDGGRR